MISDTKIAYGSLVRRQGKSRFCAANHLSRFARKAFNFGRGHM
jgi:hypothetical protein